MILGSAVIGCIRLEARSTKIRGGVILSTKLNRNTPKGGPGTSLNTASKGT